MYDIDDEKDSDFYFNEYDQIKSWIYERKLTSGHLIGGPHLSFYRHKDNIRIIWKTEYTLENGQPLWTAKNGSYEMLFQDFVDKVEQFGQEFFLAMDKQIEEVIQYDWKNVSVDKPRLAAEHQERKVAFQENLEYLKNPVNDEVSWIALHSLYERMLMDINY